MKNILIIIALLTVGAFSPVNFQENFSYNQARCPACSSNTTHCFTCGSNLKCSSCQKCWGCGKTGW